MAINATVNGLNTAGKLAEGQTGLAHLVFAELRQQRVLVGLGRLAHQLGDHDAIVQA